MTVSVIGSDQHHYPSDFTLGVSFNYTNTKEDGVEIVGTPKIQATLRTKPEVLAAAHVESGGKTQCTADVDCPSSYCMVKTNAPFFCHDCGDNCCNSDADCGKSYCMSGPDKTAPFSCHGKYSSEESVHREWKANGSTVVIVIVIFIIQFLFECLL